MDAIILGSGPGLPQSDRNLSSLLIRHEMSTILADCGDGCIRRLLEHGVEANELDAVFVTHYHPDHVSGLFMLLQMLYLMKRQKTLQLFLPERPGAFMEILQLMYTFTDRFGFRLQVLDMEQVELYYDWISVMPNDHLRGYEDVIKEHHVDNLMKAWSMRFTGNDGNLVYTSDIATTDCIEGLLRNAHTAIVDAGHPEAEQIIKLKLYGIKRVVLTHGISASLEERKGELIASQFEYAEEDRVYRV